MRRLKLGTRTLISNAGHFYVTLKEHDTHLYRIFHVVSLYFENQKLPQEKIENDHVLNSELPQSRLARNVS